MTMDHIVTGDIGGRLRRAREHRGMSLRDVARLTKLSITVLQAIERNDFTSLPGGMFRKAYVRTLAAEVGLNPNEIAADYCERFEPPIEPPAVPNREAALQEKWLEQLTPSPRRSIVTLAVLAAPAAAWFMLQPGRVERRVTLDDAASAFVATPRARGASITLTADGRRKGAPTAIAGQTTDVPLRIELAATGWCWVAAETDGERVLYRLVEPGESLMLEGHRMIRLRLGDAGAVTLSINDGPRRSLGLDGEVAELEVTPDNVDGLRDSAVEAVSDAG
jgi:cytoskeleton protein RodZ